MRHRGNVFGSNEELRQFHKLQETWGEKYNVYHNLPFLNLFEGKDSVSDEEYDFLKKTSVDFVICKKGGEPLLAIEFDGLQHGHNVGVDYLPGPGGGRTSRKQKLDLKLRIAHEAEFPFFVFSGHQFRNFGDGLKLSIVDAVIGKVLANKQVRRKLGGGFDPSVYGHSAEEFAQLPDAQQFDLVEDWVLGVEVEADFENSPIYRRVADLQEEIDIGRMTIGYPRDRDFDPNHWVQVSCSVTDRLDNTKSAQIRIPNFATPECESLFGVAEEIGKLICLEQLRLARKNRAR